MDFKKSNLKDQSHIAHSKGLKVYLIVFSILFFGCSSSKKSTTDFVYFDSLEGEIHQLSESGQSRDVYFSQTSNRLLFIRENTNEHRTPQVYEKNLVDKTERRISFNLGENHNPQYHPFKAWIIYSSSADELIEKVDVLPAMKELGLKTPDTNPNSDFPQDIYISADDGSDMRRITSEKGFDGLGTFSRDGEKIYYVKRTKNDNSQIFEFNLKSGNKKILFNEKHKILSLSVSDSLIAWTYQAGENEKLMVKKLKGNETFFEGSDKNTFSHVELHPKEQRLLVISNIENSKNKDVYQLDLAEKCATRFSFHAAEESHPTFGPEGKSLFFISNRSKTEQIFATMIRPQLTCKPLE